MTQFSQSSKAATITVTNTLGSGAGSLHQAILTANSTAGDDQIVFTSALAGGAVSFDTSLGLITSANGAISINGDANGDGIADITVDGTGTDVFLVYNASVDVVVENLIIKNFSYTGPTQVGNVLHQQGTTGTLTLRNCIVHNNSTTNTHGIVHIRNGADGTISNSLFYENTISANSTNGAGGTIYVATSNSTVDVINSTITDNSVTNSGTGSAFGAGVFSVSSATVNFKNSIATNNSATDGGDIDIALSGSVVQTTSIDGTAVLFTNATDDDYSLAAGASNAIDMGTNSAASGITLDLAGNPRINGTVDVGAYELTVDPLSASIGTPTDVSCNGQSDGALTASASDGTSPYTYSWNNGQTVAAINSLPAGTYTVTVTDAEGNTTTQSASVSEPTALGTSITDQNDPTTIGGSDGSLTAAGSGGTAPYTYSWNNGQTVAAISGLSAGTYTVSVTDANGCGPDIQQATLSDPPISLMISEFIANPFGSESTSEWVELHNYGSTGIDINGFKLKDEDSDDDVITSTSTTIPAGGYLIIAKNKSNFESIWFGGNVVSNVLEVSGLTMSNTTDELILTDASDNVIWSLAYADDESEGKATWISTATNTPTTWGSKASPGVVRDGNDVSGSAGYEKNNATADPLAFTNTDGDTGSPLNGTVLFANSTTNNNVSCNGLSDGSLTASALGGVSPHTYSWNNGSTTATTNSLTAFTYTVTVTDANGLTATSSSTVTEPDAIGAGASVTANVSCNGDSDGAVTASPTGGTTPYTYTWNTGATSASATGLPAGTYTVTVTDANGCTDSQTATITEPTALSGSASVTGSISCNGVSEGQLTASGTGGTAPYTYTWNTGGTSAVESGLAAGTYTVTVVDANGCTDSQSVTLTEPTALGAASVVDMNVSINGGNDGQATASGSGGTPPYTYSWNNGQTTATATGLTAGTYTVSVTDNNGCGPATDQVTITEPAVLTAASIVDSNVDCNGGNDGGATASATGGVSPYTYSWNNGVTTASITGQVASTYTVTVTDANGATSTSSSTITEPTALSATGVLDMNVSINGGNDGQATAAGSGGTPPYTYSWNNGQTTATATGLPAGTYTVSVTDNNGCGPATDQVTITQPAVLTAASIVDSNVDCNGGNDGGATASATGGVSPYTYSWNNGVTTASITGQVASTYTVTVTDANGATSTSSSTITEPTALSATGVLDMNVSINGGNDGQATAAGSGGTPPYTYSWNTGATTATATGLPAGTYTVSVTDNNGCGPATDQVTITQPAVLTALSMVDFNVNCNGGSDGGASASASGGTQPYTYTWSNGATTESITNSVAGTYTVTVTDANGATSTSSSTITEPTALSATGAVDMNVSIHGSNDGQATASGSGGTPPYTYVWNTGATTATATGLPAGTYTVTVTDNNGCGPATDQVTITQPAVLTAASIVDANVNCNGGSDGGATASATGGTQPYTYAWSNGATNASITNSVAGTYSVTVTDANGATSTSSSTITEPTSLSATGVVDMNVSIHGSNDGEATASGSGGTPPYTYSWNTGATTATATGLPAGTYTVSVTDNNGCGPATDQVTITQPAVLTALSMVDFNVNCNGGSDGGASASASGGVLPYTYVWSNGSTTESITNSVAGTYTVTVTDANGATSTSSSTITEPTALSATGVVDMNVSINGGSDGGATASGSGGTPPYTYVWNTGATTATATGLPAGTYTVTVTDNNGCGPATDQVTITEPAVLIAASIVDFNVNCNGGSDGGATASATGGVMPYTYVWSNGATNASITNSVAGTYTVTVTDANGATATSSSTVTEPTELTASVAGSTIDDGFGNIFDETISCNGFTDGGLTASPTGGTGPYTYAWNIGATTSSIVGIGAGTYTVTVTDNNGCTTTAQGVVTEPDVLMANANTDMDVSRFNGFDGEISSTPTGGTGPYNYVWSNGGTTASQTFLSAGTYTVTVTDANGCTTSESTTVNQPPNTDPQFDSDPVTMVGDDELYFYLVETSDDDDHDVNVVGTTLPSWLSLENGVFAAVNFAGSPGEQGTADGTGAEARFAAPYGIEIDDNENIYVADAFGLIKRITPEGVVTTFAGNGTQATVDGTGTGASFNGPAGLAFDDLGNLYVSEIGGNVIRKITPAAVVSTFAGNGSAGMTDGTGSSASFNQPYGMTSDENGNLYVTDFNNHLIRKIDPQGVVTTLAGSGFGAGTGSGSGDGGFGSGTFADGTGTEASFNGPLGIDIDHNGNLYVADAFNAMIRKITPEGVVSQFIGKGIDFATGEPGPDSGIGPVAMGTGTDAVFAGIPVGITIDEQDNLYITQGFFGAPAILFATPGGVLETILGGGESGTADGTGTDAEFGSAFDITIDDFGNIYLAETEAVRIRKVVFGSVLIGDPTDQVGDHPVLLDASDGNGGTAQQSFTINVKDQTAPAFESGTAANFAENGTGTVYTAEATDSNSKATVTYHLGQGMDSQFFTIDPTTGILTFLNSPDFENPQDGETDNTYKVEIHASDDAQNSSDAFVVTITVTDVQEDVTPPDKPVIASITDDTGASNSDGITNDKNIIISGTAEANATVEIFTQFGPFRNTQADGNGDWVLDVTDINLIEIVTNLTAEAVDAAGNRSATSDIFVLTPDFTAPGKPVIAGITDDTGISNSDGITNDKNITISGTAEPNAIIEISTQFGALRNTQADANGDWLLDITDITLLEIIVDLTAEAVDLAGNRSAASDAFKLTPDFTAPAKPVITGISDDTGTSNSDGITNDKNITISGTAEPNTSVEVSTQFGPIRKTQADANGDWLLDITDITLVEIMVNLTAEAEDAAGNVSAKSDVFVLTPDFTAPAKPVITGITDDTGSSSSDGITKDKNITISGTAEPNSSVEVSTQFGPIRKTQADANGDWLLDITDITLIEIVVNLTAEAEDAAGNVSAKSDVFVLTPDFTAPAKPVITGITDDTGSSSSDGITKDKNITISGTAEPGATVEVSTQFGPVRKTQANAGGNWILDITDITLFEIVVNLTAEAEDAAGNVSAKSDVFVLTPDFTAPGVTIDIANITAGGYTVIALFDEPVSGLTLGEISVTGGSASNLVQDDPMSYSFMVSLSGSTAGVQITAGSAQDVAGNDNTVSNLLTLNSPNNGAGEVFNNLPNLTKTEEIGLYPNPASKVLTIDLSELSAEEVDIFLYDAAGSPVFTRQAYDQKTLKLDVSTYTSGMYIVQVYDGEQVIRKKVMVKK